MSKFSVKIVANSPEELLSLARFDLDLKNRAARQVGPNRFIVPGVLTDEQIKLVEAAGYAVEIIADLTELGKERSREVSPVDRFAERRGLLEFESEAVKGYLTPDEVESALINLQALHPSIITLIPLPNATWGGRLCRAVRLRAGTLENRAGFLVTGSMHAREWGGSDICVNFLVNLITAYEGNAPLVFGGKNFSALQIKTILENLDIFVFPDVNPDGKNISQTTDFWWRGNKNGVDLNRNFNFLWHSGIGTSAVVGSQVYKGTAPFSEPETQNVRYLFDTYPNICYYVDVHSYGQLILYNWGDDDNQSVDPNQSFKNPVHDGKRGTPGDTLYGEFIPTPDENTEINLAKRMEQAIAAVRGRSYEVRQSCGLYPTSATSDDYAFSRHLVGPDKAKIYPFTIEFGDEFVPPFEEMKKIIQDVGAALTEFCWAVHSEGKVLARV
jgi:murein tripeptide amidase MpaA